MKIDKHIEIVRSTKAGLSSLSQKSCDAIFVALSKHYSRVGISIVNDVDDLEDLAVLKPDLVWLGMKFVPKDNKADVHGRKIAKVWLTDYLDDNGVAYTGSARLAHEMELNKSLAKERVQSLGLNTAAFYVAHQELKLAASDLKLSYPLFVKPANRGGGLGIDDNSIVYNYQDLSSKVDSITSRHKSDSLIEEYLPGREFSVAILKDYDSAGYSIMPIELIAPANASGQRILSAQVKAADSEQFISVTDEVVKSQVSELALQVFHAIGAQDYGRIDIRLDKDGIAQFLEANLIPSLLDGYGNFPKACLLNNNIDYEAMILRIVELGLARAAKISTAATLLGLVPEVFSTQ